MENALPASRFFKNQRTVISGASADCSCHSGIWKKGEPLVTQHTNFKCERCTHRRLQQHRADASV